MWPRPACVLEVCSKGEVLCQHRDVGRTRVGSPCVPEVGSKEVKYLVSTESEVLGGREGVLCVSGLAASSLLCWRCEATAAASLEK